MYKPDAAFKASIAALPEKTKTDLLLKAAAKHPEFLTHLLIKTTGIATAEDVLFDYSEEISSILSSKEATQLARHITKANKLMAEFAKCISNKGLRLQLLLHALQMLQARFEAQLGKKGYKALNNAYVKWLKKAMREIEKVDPELKADFEYPFHQALTLVSSKNWQVPLRHPLPYFVLFASKDEDETDLNDVF
jgi:hypothetical protein